VTEASDDTDFQFLEPAAAGVTYYVSGTGNDANNGLSQTQPFRTLQKAAGLTNPGDTVLVMNGTYTKTVADKTSPDNNVLRITRSGNASGYITYKAMSGHSPRIFVDNNYSGIRINAAYIVIDGFTVEGNLPNLSLAEAETLAKGTDTAALTNSKFNSSGIASFPNEDGSGQPHHLIIRNNKVFNHPASGIFSNGSDYIRIEKNTVYNTSYYSAYATSGISFYVSKQIDTSTANKMFVTKNTVYKVENKVPFWYSNEANPSARVITDGNGIIIDDSRHTQSDNVPYVGGFLVENNLVYDNGGRGVNVYSSDNVTVRNNTSYQNGRTTGFTEIGVGDAAKVTFAANIFVSRNDRKPILSYNINNVSFDNNLFNGGSEAPQFPAGSAPNLIKNGDFNVDLSNWRLVKGANAGFVQNTRDEFGRNCVYINQANLPNTYDVYLAQGGLTLKNGFTYTLTFDAASSNATRADFVVKFGASSGAFTTYYGQTLSLPVNSSTTSRRAVTFTMTNPTDSTAQLELQLAGNPEVSYFCFDNIVLTETSNIIGKDPKFVAASTTPATANFRLQQTSPAVNAQTVTAPAQDIVNVTRPKSVASDLGAYESF
jgi:parallel beta-helix repeat protein